MSFFKSSLFTQAAPISLETALHSHEQFLQLETHATHTTNLSTIANYQMAVLGRYFPEFSHNGVPFYTIVDASEGSFPDDKMKRDVMRFCQNIQDIPQKKLKAFDATRFDQPAVGYLRGMRDKAFLNGAEEESFCRTYADSGFVAVILKSTKDFTQETSPHAYPPLLTYMRQLHHLHASEHEMGHALSALRGVTIKNGHHSSLDYEEYWEENLADTFATLRLGCLRGRKASMWSLWHAALVDKRVTSNDEYHYDDDSYQHMTSPSVEVACDYVRTHDVSKKTPPELFNLAAQITAPLPEDQYVSLREFLQQQDKMSHNKFAFIADDVAFPDHIRAFCTRRLHADVALRQALTGVTKSLVETADSILGKGATKRLYHQHNTAQNPSP